MKAVRYKKEKLEFFTELRKDVKNYFANNEIDRHGGTEIMVKTWLMVLVYFIPYGIMLSGAVSSVGLVLFCWLVMGIGMTGLGLVTMHDANHGVFSKYRWVNKVYEKSLYLLGGYPANWQHQHNTLHHGYTNVQGHDEDIAHGGVLRFSPHQPLKKVHKYQYIYAWFLYGLMTVSWATMKDFKQLRRYINERAFSKKNYRRAFVELVASKVMYYAIFLVLPLVLIPVAWYWVLLGFFMMHFISGMILGAIFQTAHVVPTSDYPLPDDNNELDNNWAIHQLLTTCDYAPNGKLFSWLIGGLNYQVVHHLFPNISHVHYKNIAGIVRENAQKHNIPYYVNRTFLGAIYQHTLMLKSLGKG